MNKPVSIKDIVETMEIQFDEFRNFANVKTGEVISVSEESLRKAEDEQPYDHLPDWQQEEMEAAIDIVENFENYEELPTKYEINEYEMMEDFCYTLKNKRAQEGLFDAIRGRGAFRRFKDKVCDYGVEQEWYAYRGEQYKQIAVNWCKSNKIQFTD